MDTYHFRKTIHRLPGKVIHTIPLPEPKVTEGQGARTKVSEVCQTHGFKKVLLITDQTLFRLLYHEAIVESLAAESIDCYIFSDISTEPNLTIIDNGRRMALDCQADCIIALGGGSVMDSAKMIAAGVRMPHLPVKALLLKFLLVPNGTLPLIMIPSTAGTGAELTVGAVVTNDHGHKGSTVLIGLTVIHVIHDSDLTVNAPASVTVACGIDALSHCIEGAVSDVDYNEEDMKMSMEGIRLIIDNLPKVLQEPHNHQARLALCRAAMYGGNAINTQLAGYVHAFAHSIGAKYHMSHGQAISLMLMPVLEYQKEVCKDKYKQLAQYISPHAELISASLSSKDVLKQVQDEEYFLQAIRELLTKCGVDKIQSPVREEDYDELTHMVAADSINYSAPITLSRNDIQTILKQVTWKETTHPQ